MKTEYWLWLSQRQGLRNQEKKVLLSRFGDPEDIFLADEDDLAPMGLTEKATASLLDKRTAEAVKILEKCNALGVTVLTLADENYPESLKAISDTPPVLYCLGKLPDWRAFVGVGIVGSRKATSHALQNAKNMAYSLCKKGVGVISGMAAGVDAFATAGALDAGGMAIGVLGCGIDIEYPAENHSLYTRIKKDGCLISEYPPGMRPQKWTFPERNRIISGLSCVTLVVEAPAKSGALITARNALQQGKLLFAVPGPKDFVSCAGTNALLAQGALKAESAEDILSHLPGFSKKRLDKKPVKAYHVASEAEVILQLLENGPMVIDEVIAASALGTSRALMEITRLELQGRLYRPDASRITLK